MLHTGTLYSILAAAWKQAEDIPEQQCVENIKVIIIVKIGEKCLYTT